MINWRDVPGWLSEEEARGLMCAASRARGPIIELGAWCGKSLSLIAEASAGPIRTYDTFEVGSQAEQAAGTMTAGEAQQYLEKVLRELNPSRDVPIEWLCEDSVGGGRRYDSLPVAMLFVDDHHSAEHVSANLEAWLPKLAPRCDLLFHDFNNPDFGLQAAQRYLDPGEWTFQRLFNSMAHFSRGWWPLPL